MGTQKNRLNESALKSTQNKKKRLRKYLQIYTNNVFLFIWSHIWRFSQIIQDWFSEDGVEMIFKHTLITNTLQDQALNWYKSQHWIINASNDFNHKPLSRQRYLHGLNFDIYYHFACKHLNCQQKMLLSAAIFRVTTTVIVANHDAWWIFYMVISICIIMPENNIKDPMWLDWPIQTIAKFILQSIYIKLKQYLLMIPKCIKLYFFQKTWKRF